MARPEKPIDWKKVDDLLMAGCHGTEIAPHFDMHVNTFYDKVMEVHNIGFTEYSALKRSHGDSLLRHVQYGKALKGDNSMLIWLGKNRLNQKESFQDIKEVPREELLKLEDELIRLRNENRQLKDAIQPQTGN